MLQGDVVCRQCGRSFPMPTGRGRRPLYCPECQVRRRRHHSAIRGMRHMVAMTSEWVEALGPTILLWKEELTERQNGRCHRCSRPRKLYFAIPDGDPDPGERFIGLCLECHDEWSTNRRNHAHDDRRS